MPRNKKAWASWNCLKGSSRGASGEDASVCVTYWVNLLQNLPEREPDLFVTLNPPRPPATGTTQHRVTLSHPLFNARAIDAHLTLFRVSYTTRQTQARDLIERATMRNRDKTRIQRQSTRKLLLAAANAGDVRQVV